MEEVFPIPSSFDYLVPFNSTTGQLGELDLLIDSLADESITPVGLYMTRPNFRRLWTLLQAQMRVTSTTSVSEYKVITYCGIPIFRNNDCADDFIGVVLPH